MSPTGYQPAFLELLSFASGASRWLRESLHLEDMFSEKVAANVEQNIPQRLLNEGVPSVSTVSCGVLGTKKPGTVVGAQLLHRFQVEWYGSQASNNRNFLSWMLRTEQRASLLGARTHKDAIRGFWPY